MSIIEVNDVVTRFDDRVIHDHLNLHIESGEIYAILGESGSGKSVLMKEMTMLLSPASGNITILGENLNALSYEKEQALRRQWGVLFQFGALFTSLTVAENIALQLKEYTDISKHLCDKIVREKLSMVGLPSLAASLFPSELSGGMIKRVALARALAMDPKLLFLDEPTSGLDPVGARAFDELILSLRSILDITVVVITHDLDSIFSIVDRLSVLADKRVIAEGNLQQILDSEHPFIEKFFKNDYTSKRFSFSKCEKEPRDVQ